MPLTELITIIKRNDEADWPTINQAINDEVVCGLPEPVYEIFYAAISTSVHYGDYYRVWC